MIRLCYISSVRVPIGASLLDQILAVSRRNNRAAGVTGFLVAGNRRFLQLLEGDEAAVRITYNRILADPRHFACVVIDQRHVAECQFAHWDMGQVDPNDAIGRGLLAETIATIDDPNLRAQFDGFLQIHGGQRSAA